MSRRRLAICAAALLAAGVGVVVLIRHETPHAEGPVLVVQAGAAVDEPPRAGAKERAMALVVASLSPEERARAIEIMSYAAARLEARASSLVVDFGDDIDPMTELQHALAPYAPSITAARAFERGRFVSTDFVATPARSCAAPLTAVTCVPTWRQGAPTTEPGIAERARFAAWPLAYATIADFGSVAARDRAARALRASTVRPNAWHALVLTAEDLGLEPTSDHDELQAAARRLGVAMDANDLHESAELEGLARSAPSGRVAPWLTLSGTELLVVPRLSTVARASELRAEIDSVGVPVRSFRGFATR